jgi:hypothetical protein
MHIIFHQKTMKKPQKKSENMINLGVTLRVLRLRMGYRSAEHFSYEFDLNRTAYWRWENGENITMKNFLRLCEIHNISPKTLFELVERRGGFNINNQPCVKEPLQMLENPINNIDPNVNGSTPSQV